jgi:hypothetical protein
VKRPVAWLLGAVAVFGFVRRRREPPLDEPDPRADDLRRKLAESRSTVADEQPEPVQADPESRRRDVHEAARETVEQMRRGR